MRSILHWLAVLLVVACSKDPAEPAPPECREYRVYEYVGVSADQLCPGLKACDASEIEVDCPDVFRCELFQGHDVTFIHRDLVCDGWAHCTLADDERDCPDRENLFCASGDEGELRVYTPEQACDGYNECYFAEDEKDCPDSFICPPDRPGPGAEAIPRSKVCDGVWDCSIDEYGCSEREFFVCQDGSELPRANECDRSTQCADGSDETHCKLFACFRNSEGTRGGPEYLGLEQRCDGKMDCAAGEDESNCP
jgi:hypothetical protein